MNQNFVVLWCNVVLSTTECCFSNPVSISSWACRKSRWWGFLMIVTSVNTTFCCFSVNHPIKAFQHDCMLIINAETVYNNLFWFIRLIVTMKTEPSNHFQMMLHCKKNIYRTLAWCLLWENMRISFKTLNTTMLSKRHFLSK